VPFGEPPEALSSCHEKRIGPEAEPARAAPQDTEQDETRRQDQIGQRQHAAAAPVVDRAADGRAEHGRPRESKALRDRIGQNGRQVIARSPGKRLCRPKRGDDDGAPL
jgi:hypothetical protein